MLHFLMQVPYGACTSTVTSQAREWLDGLRGGEFFFASEVPGRSSVVRPLLSRLAADEASPIHREMQGFYSKLWHEDDDPRVPYADRVYGALKLAGPGGGAASAFALNWLGWTLQHPCKYDFAVVGRPPTSPWKFARFRRRSNESRRDLSWAEVTLIESIRAFGILECVPWDTAMDMLRSGVPQQRLGGITFRPEALLSSGADEQSQPREFRQRLQEAADVLAEPIAAMSAGGMREPVPRLVGGYGHSPAFKHGSDANEALREGFRNAVDLTVWGEAPEFDEANEAVRGLDR